MASASSLHSEEQFLCCICLDVFTDPITTPCGHNYCKTCITQHWDSSDVCQCPLCQEIFYRRPRCSVNKVLSEMADQFRKSKELKQLRRIQQYAVDVTLDPDTAPPYLILSEGGKQVSHGDIHKDLPNNTERFSSTPCVLGKQSFSSGRFYYEVQVKGKTAWGLGVARESINRKVPISLHPNNGYWAIGLRNGNEYATDVLLPVREKLQTVGVFVDYEEGLVSFYDVKTSVHLYSFTGCTFTEKLYPYFSPFLNDNGKNSAPLIISPVNHIDLSRSAPPQTVSPLRPLPHSIPSLSSCYTPVPTPSSALLCPALYEPVRAPPHTAHHSDGFHYNEVGSVVCKWY